MPLPTSDLAAIQDAVGTAWGTLQTSVNDAVVARAEVVTATATVATKQAAYDAALAAWILAESPPSGAEFDAKEAALAELTTATGALGTAQATAASAEVTLMGERKAFGRTVADLPLTLFQYAPYGPPVSPAAIADLIREVALAISPTF